jgi:protein TonB
VRPSRRHRLAGLAAALLIEALVVLALLTLGTRKPVDMAPEGQKLTVFDISAPAPEPAARAEPVKTSDAKVTEQRPKPLERPQARPAPAVTAPTPPAPEQPSPLVQLSRDELAAADLRSMPSASRPPATAGPPAPRGAADTPLVDGSGPNGERLYAAAWQREPYDSELKGYLSTAQPGWAMIACRTVPDFRVDDCVAVAEHPRGSQLARAVLAAAWQFRVRPPRIGGQLQVGEWVRIRIDYGVRRQAAWEKDGS